MQSDQTSILVILFVIAVLFIGTRLKNKNEEFDEKSAGQSGPSLDDSLDQLAMNKKEEKKELLNEKKEEKKRTQTPTVRICICNVSPPSTVIL